VPVGFHWPSQLESLTFVVVPLLSTEKHAYFGESVPVPHVAEHAEGAPASGPQYEYPPPKSGRTTGTLVTGARLGYGVIPGGMVSGLSGHRVHGWVVLGRAPVTFAHLSNVVAKEVTPVAPWQVTGRVFTPDPHVDEHTLQGPVA